jgi:hypothetical protein
LLPFLFAALIAVTPVPQAGENPAHEPQLAVSGSFTGLTYGAGDSIYFVSSRDGGKTFTSPVRVGGAPVIPLNRHRGPRIAISGGTIVVTAVAGKTPSTAQHAHGLPSDGDLVAWRSTDWGLTWSKGTVVNDVPGATTEGLHTIAADAHGNLFAAWLDHRGEKGTKLYGARSTDGGITWSKNVAIYASPDGSICECCHPSAVFDGDGRILVMFRNSLGGSRDLYLTKSHDGVSFSKPERLGTGTWKINGCPMDGGGLVVANGRIVSAWRREHDIFLASPGENEVDLGSGTDVSISAGPGGVYTIWSTPAGIQAMLPGKKEPAPISKAGSFPNVVALPGRHALAAWEDEGRIFVQQLP